MMKRLLTVSSFALLCFSAPAIAQDAEEFDPYAAYKNKAKAGEVSPDIPEPVGAETKPQAKDVNSAPKRISREVIEEIRGDDGKLLGQIERDTYEDGSTKENIRVYHDKIPADQIENVTSPLIVISEDDLDINISDDATPETETEKTKLPDELENYISSDRYFRDRAKDRMTGEPIPVEDVEIALSEDALRDEIEAEVETELEVEIDVSEEEILAPEPEPEPEPETEPEPEVEKNTKPAAELSDLPVSAFYLTADEYRAQRKSGEQEQLVLNYKISRTPIAGAGASSQRSLTLILGSDFAFSAFTGPGEERPARIYDFDKNRILQLSMSDAGEIGFTNGSLYAPVLRNTRLVSALTEKGKAKMVQAGPTQSLHPVWIEAAMSYTMADRRDDFTVEFSEDNVLASFDGETVFKLTFADTAYPNPDMSDVFLAYAHHTIAIHPALMRYLYASDRPLQSMEITLYGPDTPGGAVERWELTETAITEAGFPLPDNALGVTHKSEDPLTMVLRASFDTPAPSLKSLGMDVTSAINDEAPFAALLAAQRYQDFAGPCSERESDPICIEIGLLMARSDLPENAAIMAKAFKDAQSRPRYGKAVSALLPFLEAEDAPAAALFTAGITRAKLTDVQAADAGVLSVDPEPLLLRALMLDPHNPSYLLGLAQLFAVKDRYEAAWDIQDSLRIVLASEALDGTTLTSPIARMERNIEKDAPGHFAR